MNFHKTLIAGMALLFFASATAQQTKLLTADKHNEYGLVYSLPVTALQIEVTAEHIVQKAGPFHQYAKKYLGITDVISSDSEEWNIKAVRVTPIGMADASEQYLMQLKAGALTYISVSEDGCLLSINKETETEILDSLPTTDMLPSSLDDNEYLQYVDEDFLASQSSAKRAQMLAQSLMEVRNAKIALSRGTAESMPTDGRQLELMLNSLAHQEKTMTDAFTGTTQSETIVKTFTFTPDAEAESDEQVLFRLSDFEGFVDADNYSGDPIYISFTVTRRGELPVDEKGETKRLPKDAVIYTIPGAAKVKISTMFETLYNEELEFSQFGITFGLNPSLFSSKKEPSYATFDPATGALRSLGSMETTE